jgi:L-ascorbate metabolism protein UlaG (beta-lactamase superfamily)
MKGGLAMAAAALLAAGGCSSGPTRPAGKEPVSFQAVQHASFVIAAPGATVYVDPVGKPEEWAGFARPDLILITHTHGDHLAPELVKKLRGENTAVVGPKAVVEKLGFGTVLANGESTTAKGIGIEALPMYNLTKERLQYHPKGQGNGYVLTAGGKRVYVSGDTEDIPEMRALRNIDYAFVCMNLPYTMTPEQAASAVREMKPRVVIPYHYRGKDGMSDLERFKGLVGPGIEVRMLKWYD